MFSNQLMKASRKHRAQTILASVRTMILQLTLAMVKPAAMESWFPMEKFAVKLETIPVVNLSKMAAAT